MTILLTLTMITLSVLATAHIIALQFFLYWKYNWFDIPMHFLGGVCVALGFGILPFFRIRLKEAYDTLLTYVAVVLVVGLFWEVFEIVGGVNVIDEYFVGDTLIDLLMDILGGMLGYVLVHRLRAV
jgi:hypothetical protein